MHQDDKLLWMGAENTLNTLRNNWTDDNDLNRQMIDLLLAQAILKIATS